MCLRKERSNPVNLCFQQPETITYHASPLCEPETHREPSLKQICGS
jgi:hypothetical protein